jgi:hypothetical protein
MKEESPHEKLCSEFDDRGSGVNHTIVVQIGSVDGSDSTVTVPALSSPPFLARFLGHKTGSWRTCKSCDLTASGHALAVSTLGRLGVSARALVEG